MSDEAPRVATGEVREALERIRHEGTPRDVAVGFDSAVRDLYWKAKDLQAVVEVAREGVEYCLANMDGASEPDDRRFFGDHAKTLAYNLASFTWPGWDETGISPSADDLTVGLEAARLNLRLAVELNKPIERMEDAHWLLGAHLLAADQPGAALSEFQVSSPATRPLSAGYVLLSQTKLGIDGAQRQFDALLASFEAQPGGAGSSAAKQLATAYRVFVSR